MRAAHVQHSSGVRGRAELVLQRHGRRTVVASARVAAPMAVVRPFDLPDGRVMVQLITLGPGLCGGDTVDIQITAGKDARAVITTTAATRIMTMDANDSARQHVHLHAADGASLEYYPSVTIPFPDSSFRQQVEVTACSSARVGLVESWALGRAARDEYLRFRTLRSRTTLEIDGRLSYADATELEPAATDLAGAGILSGCRYLASGFWYGASFRSEDVRLKDSDPGERVMTAFGKSAPDLVYLRALGRDAPAMDAALRRSTDEIAAAWRLSPVRFDRFRC
jgi:urease accessory protein UreH